MDGERIWNTRKLKSWADSFGTKNIGYVSARFKNRLFSQITG
jgi:hypothetical protein